MKVTVKENGLSQDIFIPESNDPVYDHDLAEAYTEKTRDQLRKRPPRPISKISKEDRQGVLKEQIEFRNRRKNNTKKYW